MIAGPLAQRLKVETRPFHEKLELVVGLPLSLTAYRSQLASFFGFITPLEQRLCASLGRDSPLLAGRLKAQLLYRDILCLDCKSDPEQLPHCSDFPSTSTLLDCLGVMYVLEGSTLGGQFIAAHLQRNFGPDVPCSYFCSYGSNVRRKWDEFKAQLAAWPDIPSHDTVVGAAIDTFIKLHRWFASQASPADEP